jgi:diguanylate cyclase
MFWKNKPAKSSVDNKNQEPEDLQGEFDRALDTLASIIRTYGTHGFDTDEYEAEELKTECEEWAKKITVGEGRKGDENTEIPETFQREWGGLRRYMSEQRPREQEYVVQSLKDLREVIHAFAHCLNRSILEDNSSDGWIVNQGKRMEASLKSNDTNVIRKESRAMVDIVKKAIGKRQKRMRAQMATLGEHVQKLKTEVQEAKTEASLDGLTRLYNRAAFDTRLERVSDLAFFTKSTPSLFMLDIDHFKAVNDTYGHPGGDEVIIQVANAMVRKFFRKEDFTARYGGEEFAVIIPETTAEKAKADGERLRKAIEELEIDYEDQKIKITISVGVTLFGEKESKEKWLERADKALYEAKKTGRNKVVFAKNN